MRNYARIRGLASPRYVARHHDLASQRAQSDCFFVAGTPQERIRARRGSGRGGGAAGDMLARFVMGVVAAAFLGPLSTAALAGAAPAGDEADEERGISYRAGAATINFSFDAGFGAFSATNTGFGLGSTSIDATGPRKGTRQWLEGFAHPILKGEYALEDAGTAYAVFSVIGAATRGDGDAASPSTTADHPQRLLIEDAAVGWKSGTLFPRLGSDAFDLSVGNQSFSIGDGFIVYDGTADGGRRAMYVLGHRTAFERTAILSINTEPVRADIFHLESVTDQALMRGTDGPHSEFVGANVEWFESSRGSRGRFDYSERKRYAGLTALYFTAADSSGGLSFASGGNGSALGANRDGLKVGTARFGGAVLPALPHFALYGEYGIQRNDTALHRVRADAWYIEPQYVLPLPWSPRVSYRYAHFSGDGNPGDHMDRSWDPLFPDTGPRSNGTWTLGEIYGRYSGFANSNLNAHEVQVRAKPSAAWLVGVIAYHLDFAEPGQTAGVTAAGIMDEVDVYARWTPPVQGLQIMPLVAAARPRAGLRQALGTTDANDRTFWLSEVIARYKF